MKFIIALFNVCIATLGYTQCVMCKATAEQSGNASGINEGIIYLMPLPAIIIGVISLILYFNYKKKTFLK
jgi:hypothetical protein